LKIKHLLDVCKALKIKRFRFPKSHRKATEKPPKRIPKSTKPLKIKDLLKFFSVFRFSEKLTQPAHQTHRLTSQSVGTIFAGKTLVFSIYFCFTEKLKNSKKKKHQTIERIALVCFSVFFSVAFRLLFGFLHADKKHTIIKHRPARCLLR